jgi:hypothetical protein
MKKSLLLLFLSVWLNLVMAQESAEGRSIKKFTNGKDIHHPLNKDAKYKLMQEAVYDAIEKGAAVKISMSTYSKVVDGASDHEHFDQFISTTARQYGVAWQRKSDYSFKLIDKRLWECTVKGLVTRSEDGGVNLGGDQDISTEQAPTVTKRGLNTVHISTSKGFYFGQLVGVTKEVKQKVLNDYDFYKKSKALVYITQVESGFAMGRIVKGFYRVKVGDEVNTGTYKKSRLGFKLEYSPETKYNPNTSYYSASFYTDSYVNRWGFNLGCDLLFYDASLNNDAGQLVIPHLGVSYRIGILPDLLFIIPEFNAGYVAVAESYDAESVVLNPKLYVALRLKFIELLAGANYKFFFTDLYGQTRAYPFAGVRVNLNKN